MTRSRLLAIAAVAFVLASECRVLAPARVEERFDDGWAFHRGDVEGASSTAFDDSGWRRLDLPHDWSIEDLPAEGAGARTGPFDRHRSAGGASTGWVLGGTGWYRKRFRPDGLGEGRRVEVRFDGVYMNADVWLNGVHLGNHPYGYTPFAFDLTPQLHRGGDNVLAVRVRNEGRNSRWYSGSGLYRHVWLTTTGELRVPLWGTAVTTREVTVRVRVLDPEGREVAAATRAASIAAGGESAVLVSMSVEGPRRWSLADPALHRAVADVLVGRDVVDRVETTFGIRTVEVDAARGLRIDGAPTLLRGACLHYDNGPLGAAAFDRAEERRVEILLVEVLDARGGLVPHARPTVRVALQGPGELAALASPDPLDTRGFRSTDCTAHQGVCQAILRPTGPGTLTLRAEAAALVPAATRISVE